MDLTKAFSNCNVHLYADDTVLYCCAKTAHEVITILQQAFEKLQASLLNLKLSLPFIFYAPQFYLYFVVFVCLQFLIILKHFFFRFIGILSNCFFLLSFLCTNTVYTLCDYVCCFCLSSICALDIIESYFSRYK